MRFMDRTWTIGLSGAGVLLLRGKAAIQEVA